MGKQTFMNIMRATGNAFSRSKGWNAVADYITRNEDTDSGAH